MRQGGGLHRKKGRVKHERGTKTTYPRPDLRKQRSDAKAIAEQMSDTWTKDTVKIIGAAFGNYGALPRVGTCHE
jgi:hypothetical protein